MKELNFRGEKFFHDEENNILSFHIREPFYSAGKEFNWFGATVGLGINRPALDYAIQHGLMIRVTVKDNKNAYEISPEFWLNWALKHKSIKKKGTTDLFVCQWSRVQFKTIQRSS